MRVLLYSAILYLTGVVLILFIKPKFMFNEDGSWKEFGLTNSVKYTWCPVWLFCITWALISFSIVKFSISELPTQTSSLKKNLKPGYYVINHEKQTSEGVPRYVYIGEEPPE